MNMKISNQFYSYQLLVVIRSSYCHIVVIRSSYCHIVTYTYFQNIQAETWKISLNKDIYMCITIDIMWQTEELLNLSHFSLTLSAPNCLKQTLPCSKSGVSISHVIEVGTILITKRQTMLISGETACYELTHLNQYCLQTAQFCLWR